MNPCAPPPSRLRLALFGTGILLLTAGMYWPCLHFGFTNWDDSSYILRNPWLTTPGWAGLRQLWRPGSIAHEVLYIPLTYSSFWLEARLPWDRAATAHAVNLALHVWNTGLLAALLWRLRPERWPVGLAALVFALHPLQSETVAWAMGRKDLLATAFALLALHAWRAEAEGRGRAWLAAALAAAAAALLAKPSLVALPLLLPLLDLCAGPRRGWGTWLLRVAPFLALSLAAVALNQAGGVERPAPPPGSYVLATAPLLLGDWLRRLALLAGPGAFHPWPQATPAGELLAGLCLLAAVAAGVWLWRRGSGRVLAGLAFAGLALAPALVQTMRGGSFFTADRYAYFPLVGLALAVLAAVPAAGRARTLGLAGLGTWLLVAAVALRVQLPNWRDSESLWLSVVAVQPDLFEAHFGLARHYHDNGELGRAREHYQHCLTLRPDDSDAWLGLGNIELAERQFAAAENAYRRCLRAQPRTPAALANLALALQHQGRLTEAIPVYRQAMLADPAMAPHLCLNLAYLYQALGQPDLARAAVAQARRFGVPIPPDLASLANR